MAIEIRDLRAGDARAAAELQIQTFNDTYLDMMPKELLAKLTRERLIPGWQNRIMKNDRNLLLLGAFLDGNLIGASGSGQPRDQVGYDAELWSLNIPRIHQKQGVGRKLFAETCLRLDERGFRSMYLYCIDKNENALRFYTGLGGRLTDQYVDREGYRERMVVWDTIPVN